MNIAVVIPTYNRYDFLKRALTSVFSQTYTAKEVIVVDDGSSDDTSKILQDFPDIKYVYQTNQGVSSSRNLGVNETTCEWVAFLDSDDEWHSEKLQEHVDFHKQHVSLEMSYTDEVWIRDGREVKIPKKFKKIGKDAFLENLSYCNIAPSSVLIHESIFKKVGLFNETLEVCEDYDLWLRVAIYNDIGLIDKKLIYKYAGHEDQLSFKHWGMDRFRVIALEKLLTTKNIGLSKYNSQIKEELLKKYKLLLKGAIKYDRKEDIEIYRRKLSEF